MSLLIENCRVVSPDVDLRNASVLIDGDVIKKISNTSLKHSDANELIDGAGKILLPGFIDVHFHGASGFDITDGTIEAVESIAESKLSEGVTTICPTTLTLPEDKLEKTMEAVSEYNKSENCYSNFAGVHLEGPFLNPDCLGAHNTRYVRKPDIDEVMRLHSIAKIAIVTLAPEVDGGLKLVEALKEAGISASCGHSLASFAEMIEAKKAGVSRLTHFCNRMTQLHHRETGLVGAGLMDDDLILEIICDMRHLCPEMIALIFKVKPIEKILLITDSVSASGLAEGDYELGGSKVNVKDGQVRLSSNNALAGSLLRFNEALRNTLQITGLPLKELVKTTSLNQAQSLGLTKKGRIEEGYDADLVLLDSNFEVKTVIVNGVKKL